MRVLYPDRRHDPRNFLIDRFCARSTDAGGRWSNLQVTRRSFAAVPGQDVQLSPEYMGDYDGLATDFTRGNGGFLGAFGDNARGNPDVRANRF